MSAQRFRGRRPAPDTAEQHRNWLNLIEVSGPFLTLPVLRRIWPAGLDPLDKEARERLRREHAHWQDDTRAGQQAWMDYVLGEMLGWGRDLHIVGQETAGDTEDRDGSEPPEASADLAGLAMAVAEHDTQVTPSFALTGPGEQVTPQSVRLLGLVCPAGQSPTSRVRGEAWAATPADRLASLCRHHGVELGLATDGRWWALVWAPRGGVTTTAVFDAVLWPESAERDVVYAFHSLLNRNRFFGVPDEERLVPLLRGSLDSQEEVTEALGVQVRQAVELLVAAIGRADTELRKRGEKDLGDVPAHEVYRGSVSVMMRVVFLLFAEERGLLPSDNDLYAKAYSAGRLCAELESSARETSEAELANGYSAWHRLLALFNAVYHGVDHPRLRMHAHDGSLFNPEAFPWMPLDIDDQTVLHMLRSVQYVEVGTGKAKERRALSFRALDVEQIGYVYEGLLSFDGFRAEELMIGLIGKEGREAEIPLREIEELAAGHAADLDELAATLAARYKDSKIGSKAQLVKRLTPLSKMEQEEARKKLLAVTRGDYPLAERLLAFYGIIRTDLRGLPVVVMPGELFVTESALRKNTGTHYTPKFLAEQVVEGALEPLVYEPGPLQTADTGEWKLKTSEEILALKVADIAMGSAAFLVAAARYLGEKLIEAWTREGDARVADYVPSMDRGSAEDDPVVIEARRQIIEHCLYGVDINPMAVEMAKLSLWLVSMDPGRPFTFLDDRLASGDSLLGITSIEQLEYMHMDPEQGRKLHSEGTLLDFTSGVRELVAEVAESRRKLAEIDGTTLEGLNRKRELLTKTKKETDRARLLGDLTVGAALENAGHGKRRIDRGSLAVAEVARNLEMAEPEMKLNAEERLDKDRPEGTFKRYPIHWPLTFPEAFENGGFDAIIGNPPFLGGKRISGSMGSSYREFLVDTIAQGAKGNADLIAYFILRAHQILNDSGQVGVIATNTLAQGDTREVCLDRITSSGATIRQSIKSKPWPSKSATLEYCAVWISGAPIGKNAEIIADGRSTDGINSSLDPQSRASGIPFRLIKNQEISFIGNFVNGIGFVLSNSEAENILKFDPKSKDVLFKYLNGQDLNSQSDYSASRWIIDFFDWPLDKAKSYGACIDRIQRLVKPERDRLPDSKRATQEKWWQYEKLAPGLRAAISHLDRVVVITLVSKTVMPVVVPTGQVFSHALGVFASDDTAMLALLSSAPHYWWAKSRGSSMKADLRYTPSDIFETFAMPELTEEMRQLGDRLDTTRRDVMLSRNSGLTKTYNLVFDPECTDPDIQELRDIHRAIDEATIRAYGWEDRIGAVGGLDHGFHPVGREIRYTIGPAAQREVLDSLFELNHERYAEEVAQGLHDKKNKKKRTSAPSPSSSGEGTLF
ncbi:Eco57I restriction-modification methylase domain-containing protein [Nocardiopsis sediminis]|uniref:site-specific DNA-methyltransferase (adenine-specific) n=1 Tax=Nocardiopsis sediminis TaxID=1778267 RepID=A0ABV8FHH9_9ACTN